MDFEGYSMFIGSYVKWFFDCDRVRESNESASEEEWESKDC